MNNELLHKAHAYLSDKIVYLTPTVWFLAEGGITATHVMLSHLEKAFSNGNNMYDVSFARMMGLMNYQNAYCITIKL